MIVKLCLLAISALSFGLLAAAGVFTVLAAVGLVPRFAGRTHTANKVILYEEMVVGGTLFGCIFSVLARYCRVGAFFHERMPELIWLWNGIGNVVLLVFGLACGMFIGCLALAIAEMLDSIPIFSRRIGFRHGLGLAILSMAVGKIFGALFFFITRLYENC
ncbi:stage V sporulation protein AB [Lachnospiraceae bacterium OttesenSCG-928-D06]|nr:stage V sporulation protein AB [Lachnospiraceae bacterium OttesenSCG-928-D06]